MSSVRSSLAFALLKMLSVSVEKYEVPAGLPACRWLPRLRNATILVAHDWKAGRDAENRNATILVANNSADRDADVPIYRRAIIAYRTSPYLPSLPYLP